MIQIIYRWHVPAENKDAFIAAWTATTQEISRVNKGSAR